VATKKYFLTIFASEDTHLGENLQEKNLSMPPPDSKDLDSASEDDRSGVDEEGMSYSGTSASGSSKENDEDADVIKDYLSTKVVRLRVIVIIVLLLAAAAVSTVIYLITRNSEIDEFEIQYEGNAEKVIESFTDIVKEMGAISGLGVAASANGLNNNEEWPFVTLSDLQERAGNARALSGTLYVSINPIIDNKEQLAKWEQYVLGENNQW
jgi:hypothetical protein